MKVMHRGVVLGLAALVIVATAPRAQEVSTINVGTMGIFAEGPFWIALEKGYFDHQGVKVVVHRFESAVTMMPALATNQLQVMASGGITVGLFNAAARGMPVILSAHAGSALPRHDSNWTVVRSDLRSEITSVADLKGRTVGGGFQGGPQTYILGKALEGVGLSLKDINLVYMPFQEVPTAMANKALDVGLAPEPFAVLGVRRGAAVRWKGFSDLVRDPYMQVGAVYMNSDWAQKNPDAAARYLAAFVLGARDYYAATHGGANRADVVSVLIKRTVVKDQAIYDLMEWAYQEPNGILDVASIRDQAEWYSRHGQVTGTVDIDKLINSRYLEMALARVGRFTEPHRD